MGYITSRDVLRLANAMGNSSYGQYLMRMLEQET
jgi:dTDP-glucose pyrophosphorylase